jgi:DNA-binding NtrC family response regulator
MLKQTRVLFVDDEEFLLELLDAPLEKLCQSVQFFSSPLQALKALEEKPDDFDLLISDFVMPEILGTELIRQAKIIKPELCVILATGNSSFDLDQYLEQQQWSQFSLLPKPYNMKDLEKVMRQLIEQNLT